MVLRARSTKERERETERERDRERETETEREREKEREKRKGQKAREVVLTPLNCSPTPLAKRSTMTACLHYPTSTKTTRPLERTRHPISPEKGPFGQTAPRVAAGPWGPCEDLRCRS